MQYNATYIRRKKTWLKRVKSHDLTRNRLPVLPPPTIDVGGGYMGRDNGKISKTSWANARVLSFKFMSINT